MTIEPIFTGDVVLDFEKIKMFKTLTTAFMSGKEQRRSKWTRPKHRFKWGSFGRTPEEADYIFNFYNDRQGQGESFYWECHDESPTSQSGDELLGIGDGENVTFNFSRYPIISGDCDITVGGDARTEVTDYTVNYDTGEIVFEEAPSGDLAVLARSYRFYYKLRFAEDDLSKKQFAYKLYNIDIDLVEVL
jgi:uncharacterized protein (TIGR02217 family)